MTGVSRWLRVLASVLVLGSLVPLTACEDEKPTHPTVAGFVKLAAAAGKGRCPVAWLPGKPVRVTSEHAGHAPRDSVVAQLGGRMVTCAWQQKHGRIQVHTIATTQRGGATAALGAVIVRQGALEKAALDDFLNEVSSGRPGTWHVLGSPKIAALRLRTDGQGEIVVAVTGRATSRATRDLIRDRATWQ